MTSRTVLLVVILAMVCVVSTTFGQSAAPNIATQAVCTHSGGGTTANNMGPEQYNNNIISPYGFTGATHMGWTSTATGAGPFTDAYWIAFEWPTPMTFGELNLHYAYSAGRYMNGCTIQTWNGTTWVDHVTLSWIYGGANDSLKVLTFPPATSTRMRLTKFTMQAVGQQSNPAFREIQIRNACTWQATQVDFSVPGVITLPDAVPISYTLIQPDTSFTANVVVRFYTPTNVLVHQMSTTVPVTMGTNTGTINVSSSTLPPGYYKVQVVFSVLDICRAIKDVTMDGTTMVIAPGTVPCSVWPGDVNNDGLVNYGDRRSLNQYIQDANLRTSWLFGPARYRADAGTNPMTFLTWQAQAGIPWNTPEGCYMDADGNGVINALDYLAMKINWMKSHGSAKDSRPLGLLPEDFDMQQNYPNPFNPTTTLNVLLPEASQVVVTVTNGLGQTVATLHNGILNAGSHPLTFDGANLGSGRYFATIRAMGEKSGIQFSKTVSMILMK